MRRIGRWFAVKMVGADVVGVVWLPKFQRTSAEFPPSAAATHVRASVISQCQVGSEKTSFRGLHYVGLCILSRNRMLPSPNFIQGTIFPRTRAYLGREKHNAPTRPPLPLKVNARPQSNVVSCLPAPRPQLEIIWVQG